MSKKFTKKQLKEMNKSVSAGSAAGARGKTTNLQATASRFATIDAKPVKPSVTLESDSARRIR